MTNVLDKVSKTSIYLLVFLLPLFFLPWTTNVLDFNKQFLLIFLVFLSLGCWLLKSLTEGKISLNLSTFNIPVAIYLFVLSMATLFSAYKYASFWGLPLTISSAFLTIFGFVLFYFLLMNVFKKEETFGLLIVLVLSGFLTALFGVLQIFNIIPLSYNTIGAANSLSVFIACLLPLVLSIFFISKKFIKFLISIIGLVMLGLLFLVNFWVAWVLLLIGSASLLIFGIAKKDIFNGKKINLLILLLILGLFFGIFRIQIPFAPSIPLEVAPSQSASLSIAGATLKSHMPGSLMFGSGPGTFVYDYSQFKSETINQTAFWGVRFGSGASDILDKLATTGILGLVSFLGILIMFIWLGLKAITGKKQDVLGLGIFSAWLTVVAGIFLYPTNMSLGFLFWIFTSVFIALQASQLKTWEIKPSSLASVGISFLFLFILICGLGLFVFAGQRYAAEIRYRQGISAFQRGDNLAAGQALFKAISYVNGKQDNYWRDIAQVNLFRISEELQKPDVSAEKITPLVSDAINAAKRATDAGPNNVANYTIRGFVYRQIIGLVEGVEDWAIKSYEKALILEPTNPYIYTELGRVYLAKEDTEKARDQFQKALELKSDYAPAHFQMAAIYISEGKQDEAIEKMKIAIASAPFDTGLLFQLGILYYQEEMLDQAKIEFEKAVSLQENYSNARYFLGLIYDKQGDRAGAIAQFEKIAEMNPDNEEVENILVNLRAGRGALEGIEEVELIEEKPEEQL
ncbi:tetratricopeptide repeat protein [Candidatus Parcubacteria bacterium]|nr:tetratricopeptide repeat protein [Candidatus Parcubacteria bacterium]